MLQRALVPPEPNQQDQSNPHQCPSKKIGYLRTPEYHGGETGHKKEAPFFIRFSLGKRSLLFALQENMRNPDTADTKQYRDEEEETPTRVLRDDATNQRAQGQSHVDRCYRDAKHLSSLIRGKRGDQDGLSRGIHKRGAHPLQETSGDEPIAARCEVADCRRRGEDKQSQLEQLAVVAPVAPRPRREHEERCAQEERGDDPTQLDGSKGEVVFDGGEGNIDRRYQKGTHERGDGYHE